MRFPCKYAVSNDFTTTNWVLQLIMLEKTMLCYVALFSTLISRPEPLKKPSTVQDLWAAQYSYRSPHRKVGGHLSQDFGVSQESAHSTELSIIKHYRCRSKYIYGAPTITTDQLCNRLRGSKKNWTISTSNMVKSQWDMVKSQWDIYKLQHVKSGSR